MAFDFASVLPGLANMFGMGPQGSMENVLGGVTGMQAPGVIPQGMGNQQTGMTGIPGASQLPGQGVQFPGASAQPPAAPIGGDGMMVNILQPGMAQREMSPMAQALMKAGPMMTQQAQMQAAAQQQQAPGALPIASQGMGRGFQGYQTPGGGIAPRRVIRG